MQMPGLSNFLGSKHFTTTISQRIVAGMFVHLALVGLGVLSSCGSSREAGDSAVPTTETLHKFEAEFDPSQYNPDVEELVRKESPKNSGAADVPVEVANPVPAELVQGFRVQIHASTSIDQTSHQKELAEELFPAEWFYLVYDPPTYKLRAGNFLTRFEADRFLKELKESGFSDSWIVPDKVVQNPGPRPAQPKDEGE